MAEGHSGGVLEATATVGWEGATAWHIGGDSRGSIAVEGRGGGTSEAIAMVG